mmetsp:Transcript_53105/g.99500  ORF Transcript_53105/g.99500 Transcript_53105/m.99500 type:complete len:200 (-) Transcript_53105:449-1048(-)
MAKLLVSLPGSFERSANALEGAARILFAVENQEMTRRNPGQSHGRVKCAAVAWICLRNSWSYASPHRSDHFSVDADLLHVRSCSFEGGPNGVDTSTPQVVDQGMAERLHADGRHGGVDALVRCRKQPASHAPQGDAGRTQPIVPNIWPRTEIVHDGQRIPRYVHHESVGAGSPATDQSVEIYFQALLLPSRKLSEQARP